MLSIVDLQAERKRCKVIVPWYDRVLGAAVPITPREGKVLRTFILAIAALGLSVGLASLYSFRMAGQSSAADDYRTGLDAFSHSDYKKAIDSLRRATAREPLKSEAFLQLGHAYFAAHREEEAVEAWEIAIGIDDSMDAHRARRRYFLNLGWANPDPMLDDGWRGRDEAPRSMKSAEVPVPEKLADTVSDVHLEFQSARGAVELSRTQILQQ